MNEDPEDITEETLASAAKMFIYLTFCPPTAELHLERVKVAEMIDTNYKDFTPKEILIILNRLLHVQGKGQILPLSNEFSKLMDKVRNRWNLQYEDIRRLTGKQKCDTKDCTISSILLDDPNLSTVTNHPVHIIDKEGEFSPSSFIPSCWFGGVELGIETGYFDAKVCNSFKQKLFNDQVCYEMDIHDLITEGETVQGKILYLILDQNKDRAKATDTLNKNLFYGIVESSRGNILEEMDGQSGTFVYLDTIGGINYFRNINL